MAQGPQGLRGPQGAKGDKGDPGATGSRGLTGQNGLPGHGAGPAFIATITSGQNLPTSPGQITQFPLVYNSATQNIGNGYNPTTGIFTAPNTGFYQVSGSISVGLNVPLTLQILGAEHGGALVLYRNGVPISSGQFISLQGYISNGIVYAFVDSSSLSTLVYMTEGETLQCKIAYYTDLPNNYLNTQSNIVNSNFQAVWIRGRTTV